MLWLLKGTAKVYTLKCRLLLTRLKKPTVEAGRFQRKIRNYIYLKDIFARQDKVHSTCSNSAKIKID